MPPSVQTTCQCVRFLHIPLTFALRNHHGSRCVQPSLTTSGSSSNISMLEARVSHTSMPFGSRALLTDTTPLTASSIRPVPGLAVIVTEKSSSCRIIELLNKIMVHTLLPVAPMNEWLRVRRELLINVMVSDVSLFFPWLTKSYLSSRGLSAKSPMLN